MSQTIKFSLSFNQRRQHLADVTLTFTTQSDNPIISLPVWSPGSYLVRDYSRHLRGLSSNTVDVQQLDKASYQITAAKDKEISLTYQVYANELTVRT